MAPSGVEELVTVSVPAGRSTHRFVLILQMLIQKKPRLEFAERVLICRSSTDECRQRYVRRHIALSEIRRWMENLLRRERHVLVDDLPRISLLEISNEFRAAQVWKDQRRLNTSWRLRQE